ncbi:uncharacterized protein LOC128166952 [Crassostrea angulata]|uniref:uncharacterized protein LOC128166952 n=1 Tax=Magallana angulata TaxID=2784310 RepID=UPI0022B100B5|nr:uncharacterized protein LOC128166952 [Crassostrea angulata]
MNETFDQFGRFNVSVASTNAPRPMNETFVVEAAISDTSKTDDESDEGTSDTGPTHDPIHDTISYSFNETAESFGPIEQVAQNEEESIAEVEPMKVTVNRPITYQIEDHGTNQGKRKLSDSRGFTYTVKVRDKCIVFI